MPAVDSRHTHINAGSPNMHEAVNTVMVYRLSCEHRNLLLHYLSQMSIYVCVYMCVYKCVFVLYYEAKHVFLACAVLP